MFFNNRTSVNYWKGQLRSRRIALVSVVRAEVFLLNMTYRNALFQRITDHYCDLISPFRASTSLFTGLRWISLMESVSLAILIITKIPTTKRKERHSDLRRISTPFIIFLNYAQSLPPSKSLEIPGSPYCGCTENTAKQWQSQCWSLEAHQKLCTPNESNISSCRIFSFGCTFYSSYFHQVEWRGPRSGFYFFNEKKVPQEQVRDNSSINDRIFYGGYLNLSQSSNLSNSALELASTIWREPN